MNRLTIAFLSALGTILSVAGGVMLGELLKENTDATYILIAAACLFFGGLFGGLSVRY